MAKSAQVHVNGISQDDVRTLSIFTPLGEFKRSLAVNIEKYVSSTFMGEAQELALTHRLNYYSAVSLTLCCDEKMVIVLPSVTKFEACKLLKILK